MERIRKGGNSTRSTIYRLSAHVGYGMFFILKQSFIKWGCSSCDISN